RFATNDVNVVPERVRARRIRSARMAAARNPPTGVFAGPKGAACDVGARPPCRGLTLAFQLRPDESMAHEFRRLARTELKSARKESRKTQPPRDEAIHQARKRVKKVRAIVQLIDDGGGRGLDRSAKRLRSVNRTLSELRDTDAMMQTLASLRRRHRRLFSEH